MGHQIKSTIYRCDEETKYKRLKKDILGWENTDLQKNKIILASEGTKQRTRKNRKQLGKAFWHCLVAWGSEQIKLIVGIFCIQVTIGS